LVLKPHESDQDFGARFFVRAGGMLVRPHNRSIQKNFLKIRVFAKLGKKCLPDAFVRPAREAPKRRIPWPKVGREITPGSTCSCHPENRFDKQAIICTGTPTVSCFAVQHRLDSYPLVVT
jgi:hypothetical protein